MERAAPQFGSVLRSSLSRSVTISIVIHGLVLGGALAFLSARTSEPGVRKWRFVSEMSIRETLREGRWTKSSVAKRAAVSEQVSLVSEQAPVGLEIHYPESARKRREQGTVHAEWHVLPDGRVTDIVVRDSSGSLALDRAVMEALANHRYAARGVDETKRAKFNFRLKDGQ